MGTEKELRFLASHLRTSPPRPTNPTSSYKSDKSDKSNPSAAVAFCSMLCSPYGEISTLKACGIIAYGLAHRFKKGISYHMHAVGVREGAKHPILGRLPLRVPPV